MNTNELLDKVNKDLKYYEIVLVSRALGEDGKYFDSDENIGYGLLNLTTGILEHTSTMLPGVMWQAQHFEQTLSSILNPDTGPVAMTTDGDVVPILQ